MKLTTTSKIEHQLARHDRRARSNSAFPATDHFFRPQPDGTWPRRRRPSERARSAFRRMTLEMLAKHERIDTTGAGRVCDRRRDHCLAAGLAPHRAGAEPRTVKTKRAATYPRPAQDVTSAHEHFRAKPLPKGDSRLIRSHKLTVLSPPILENVDRFAAGPITGPTGAALELARCQRASAEAVHTFECRLSFAQVRAGDSD